MKTSLKPTLFARYKDMINAFWEDGKRTYTSKDLNNYVGTYENETWWKRGNNNPYYTTRLYQGLLRQFGCVSMVKRGLWQINGPVPNWFGSFHFKGLRGGYDMNNKYADHNCFYWNNLPAEHKINPWKNINPMRVMSSVGTISDAENQRRRNELNATLDAVKEQNKQAVVVNATTTQYHLHRVINIGTKDVQVTFEVFVSPSKNPNEYVVDIADINYTIIGENHSLSNEQICDVCRILLGTVHYEMTLNALIEDVKREAIAAQKVKDTVVVEKPAITKDLLMKFAKHFSSALSEEIVEDLRRMDADDLVSIDFDTYNKSYSVDVETQGFEDIIDEVISDNESIESIIEDFMQNEGLK